VDIYALMAVAEEKVVPLMDQPIRVDHDSLLLGYAGVYSSFLLHAKRASERHGVPEEDILLELGRMRTVGGQQDMIDGELKIVKRHIFLDHTVIQSRNLSSFF
jgi:4-hydroxy-2-oxovalerate/4-hydroxy-2-oxohexanoate aldolase